MVLCNRLSSEQEEADAKSAFCEQFTFDIGFERVNIVTVDIDVAILGMYSIFSPSSMGRCTFNMEHHQQQRCMTCLKIHWIEVLL